MRNVQTTLESLRRPPLLIRAARIGLARYDRDRQLPRHLGHAAPPQADQALERLLEIEADIEADRLAHATGYLAARHVEILIAILGEARRLREPA